MSYSLLIIIWFILASVKCSTVLAIPYKIDDVDHRAASCKQREQDEYIYPYHERESHEHFIHGTSP